MSDVQMGNVGPDGTTIVWDKCRWAGRLARPCILSPSEAERGRGLDVRALVIKQRRKKDKCETRRAKAGCAPSCPRMQITMCTPFHFEPATRCGVQPEIGALMHAMPHVAVHKWRSAS